MHLAGYYADIIFDASPIKRTMNIKNLAMA